MALKRFRRVVVGIVLTITAFVVLSALSEMLRPLLRQLLGGAVPKFASELYEDISYSLVLVIAVIAFRSSTKVGLQWPDRLNGWVALLGIVCYVTAANWFVGGFSISHITTQRVFFFCLTKMLTGFWEELFFRGVAMKLLEPCGVVGSMITSSICFGLLHSSGPDMVHIVGNVLFATSIGLALAMNRMQTNSLLPAMIAHGLIDSLMILSSPTGGGEKTTLQYAVYVGFSLPIFAYCFATIRRREWPAQYNTDVEQTP